VKNRILILFASIFLLTILGCEQKKTFEERLVERDGLKYEVNSLKPFTGITSFGKEQYTYKNGKRHGKYILYNCPAENNLTNLSEIGVYKNNKFIESKHYVCGTNKIGKIFRINGKNITYWRWWVDSITKENKCFANEVATKVVRVNGKKEGIEEIYEPNNYCGEKNSKMYLEKIYNYKDGMLHGEYLHYYWEGYLYEKGNYFKGKKNGLFTSFYKNGNPKRIDDYIIDKRFRKSREFDEQGRLILISDYSSDFKDGIEIKFKYIDNKQIKISTQEYKHFGNKFGLEINYNDDGSIKESFCWDFKKYPFGLVSKDDYRDKTEVVSSKQGEVVKCRTAIAN